MHTSMQAPGPRAWPVLGNLGMLKGRLPFMEAHWARHGDVFRMQPAGYLALVVVAPEPIQRVLIGSRKNYVRGAVYSPVRRLIGDRSS